MVIKSEKNGVLSKIDAYKIGELSLKLGAGKINDHEVIDYDAEIGKDILNMKPANIMLKPDGSIRLIDFGIAREYKEGKAGDTEAIGTRGYAAPEQFGGQGQTDARTDIYSLGVTLYHLVTGKILQNHLMKFILFVNGIQNYQVDLSG